VKILLLLGCAFVCGVMAWLVSYASTVGGCLAVGALAIVTPHTSAFWVILAVLFVWYGWYFHCLWLFHVWDTKRNQVTDRCVRCGAIRFK